jgi:hypothetical protein
MAAPPRTEVRMVASETLERATRSGPRPGDDEDRGNVGDDG